MALLFNVTGGWEQLLYFLEKKIFFVCFFGIRIKMYFPLKSPFTNIFQVGI